MSIRALLPALFAALLLASPPGAHAKELSRAEVEAIVKKVIEDNPELIVRSVAAFQLREQAQAMTQAARNVVALQKELVGDGDSPSVGNPKGDVTVVEFFDYHCGYCKHFFPELTRLLAEDRKVRVVFKELPILSPDSLLASRASLAVNRVDKSKYLVFHTALMKSSGQFTNESLAETARNVGVNPGALAKMMENPEIDHEIERVKTLAQALHIGGTPTLVIGAQLVPGAIEYDTLKERVSQARRLAQGKR